MTSIGSGPAQCILTSSSRWLGFGGMAMFELCVAFPSHGGPACWFCYLLWSCGYFSAFFSSFLSLPFLLSAKNLLWRRGKCGSGLCFHYRPSQPSRVFCAPPTPIHREEWLSSADPCWFHEGPPPHIAAVAVFCPRHLSSVLLHCSLSFCPSSL